jgi:hypothetical protein
MIYTAHVVGRMQGIPRAAFVGVYDGARSNMSADQRQRSAFAGHYERQSATHHFADHNDDPALAGLFFG